ncbi:MAG: hypothetical protein ABJV60_02745 [Lentilitoribacter sp.]
MSSIKKEHLVDPIDTEIPTYETTDTTGLTEEEAFEDFAEEVLGLTYFADMVLEAVQEQEE